MIMLGDLLQELREDMNIRQEDLAKVIGVSKSSIGKYECNDNTPSLKVLIRLAQFFNVNIDYLCGLTRVRTSWKDLGRFMGTDGKHIPLEEFLNGVSSLSEEHQKALFKSFLEMRRLEKLSRLEEQIKQSKLKKSHKKK